MSFELLKAAMMLKLSPAEKLVLMALADRVPSGGRQCYPSIAYIAWQIGFSERQVQRARSSLVTRKIVAVIENKGGGRGLTRTYEIQMENGDVLSPFRPERVTRQSVKGDRTASERVTNSHPNLKENLNTNLPQKDDGLSPFNANGIDYAGFATDRLQTMQRLARIRKEPTPNLDAELTRRMDA